MNRHYCVRLVKPERMQAEPRKDLVFNELGRPVYDPVTGQQKVTEWLDTNPVCGILGLPAHAKNAYICGRFSMPVVGGPSEFIEPFEWASFDEAMADINSESTHKLGLSFDWPIPVDAVRWRLRLYHYYDGSHRFPVVDLLWSEFRLYWLAGLGVASQCGQVKAMVSQRLVDCEGLRMPDGYTVDQCSTYRASTASERTEKAGSVDDWVRLLRGNHA